MNMRLLVFAKTEYCDGTMQWQNGPLIHSVQHTHSATGLLAGTAATSAKAQFFIVASGISFLTFTLNIETALFC